MANTVPPDSERIRDLSLELIRIQAMLAQIQADLNKVRVDLVQLVDCSYQKDRA
jgi:hypothetical protein